MLRAYSSCTSNSDSTPLERTCYYVRYAREASILSIMFNIFDEQALQAIIFAIFDKQARQAINIFLIYRNLNTIFL